MSWLSSREIEREKLEGSLLTVCTDCKDMVLQVSKAVRNEKKKFTLTFLSLIQVIRTSRTTRRMQMVRSMFLSLAPEQEEQRL